MRRAAMRLGIGEIFDEYDAIITPATIGVAPKGEATGDPVFCSLWTLTGLPALSLPLLNGEGGMPLGVQLIGAAGDDARLFRTANWLVQSLAVRRAEARRPLFLLALEQRLQSSPQNAHSIKARPIMLTTHSGGAASLAAIRRI